MFEINLNEHDLLGTDFTSFIFHITSKTTLENVGKSSNSQANHTLYIQSKNKIIKIMKEM